MSAYIIHLDTTAIDAIADGIPSTEHLQYDNGFYMPFCGDELIHIPVDEFFQMPSTMEHAS